MRKYIRISKETRDYLVKKYGVSKISIWKALCFITKNERSENIRQDAIAQGGIIVEEGFVPNCRTEHRNGTIIQTFAGGVQVVTDSKSTRIIVGDSTVESFKEVTVKSWGNVLARAQEISQKRVFNN